METPNPVKLGGFLFVPNVQEFAKQSPGEVPARYIRNDQDPLINNISGTCMLDQTVPIIDFQKLLSPVPIIGESELDQLHSACKEWGFFQVVNYGIDNLLVEKVKSETQDFFNVPMDEKNIFLLDDGDIGGFGQAFVHSEEQKLDWGDMFFMLTLPKTYEEASAIS
ncbi:codeine O-demethylase-like [Papaver somniferum]|uniref:codeine O-demethylase-like n=1 Tax=Papaver somniferum TaxID=3469 RepID=UPI000E700D8A|nr:codeine O-demethylase-like [Papaver somniferum]